jgi:hypothetical protein
MVRPRSFAVSFLVSCVLAFTAFALFNFVIDPLQLFHKPILTPARYSADARQQNAGLIHSQEFNAVFMGSSLGVHFRQSDIDRYLGVHSLKLSMSGATSRVQSFVLDAALKKPVKTVIWEMDYFIFRDGPSIESDATFPADLYRMNLKGMAEYVSSLDTGRESLWMLLRQIHSVDAIALRLSSASYLKFTSDDVDSLSAFPRSADLSALYNAKKAMAAYLVFKQPVRPWGYEYDVMVPNFERDVIALIDRHPDVKFEIYFPPYSILHFAAMRDVAPTTMTTFFRLASYMNRRLLERQNVDLFDFRDIEEVTHNLDNYLDTVHHSPQVDRQVLEWLRDGQHRVAGNEPDLSLKRLRHQIESYVLPPAIAGSNLAN